MHEHESHSVFDYSNYVGVSILMHKDHGAGIGPACRELWSHPKILDVLEQLMGPGSVLYVHKFTSPLATKGTYRDRWAS